MKNTVSLKKHEFPKVYNRKKSYSNKYLVIYFLNNRLDYNKLGISVSKKVGNSVVRHRITRLIRESYRLEEDNIKNGYNIVFIARVPSKEASYKDINESLVGLLKKISIYKG